MPKILDSEKSFLDTIKSSQLTVVHFSASWLEQCKHVDDLLDCLAKQSEFSTAHFFKCDAEDLSPVSLRYNIEAAPTVIIYRSGNALDRVNGADPAKITAKIQEFCKKEGGSGQVSLEERLKGLINSSKVMLFMKGDRNAPRCGFSKQIIALLNDTGVSYDTFDILTDEEVRQGLKTYSDWPTYPQLYAKGELLGGLDIVKELLASGELLTTLNA